MIFLLCLILVAFQNCSKPASFSIDEAVKESILSSTAVLKTTAADGYAAGSQAININPLPVCGPSQDKTQSVLNKDSSLVAVLYYISALPGSNDKSNKLVTGSIVQQWDTNVESNDIRDSLFSILPFQLKIKQPLKIGKYSLVVYDKSVGSVPEIYHWGYSTEKPKNIFAVAPVVDSIVHFVDPQSTFDIDSSGKQITHQSMNVFIGFDGESQCKDAGVKAIDPLVIQLKTDQKIELTSPKNGVWFDLFGSQENHTPVLSAWFSKSITETYFLTLPNHGRIEGIDQLFGDKTLGPDRKYASHGFAALAKYDSNNDGRIDDKDKVYYELKLWNDKNRDGVAQPEELFSLSEKDVMSIDLRFDSRYQEIDRHGNMIKYKSVVSLKNNQYGLVYDLWLRFEKR